MPPDVLGVVLRHLPSLADHIRLSAVCRPWRSGASLQPPPHLPWLVFRHGTLFDLSSKSETYRVPLPKNTYCLSAGGNMIFFMQYDRCRCWLMNALSGATTNLPELAAFLRRYNVHLWFWSCVRKVVMMSSSNHGPIVAVLVHNRTIVVSTCRPAGEINSYLVMQDGVHTVDIALFQGKICALIANQCLVALKLDSCLDLDKPPLGVKQKAICGIALIPGSSPIYFEEDGCVVEHYLVESNGKLLQVKRWFSSVTWRRDMQVVERTRRFEVWEANFNSSRWNKFDGALNRRALFVSASCSRFVPAGHGVREDCIYFLPKLNTWRMLEGPLGDSGVYNIRDKTFTPLLPESVPLLPWQSSRFPAWFFPH